MNLSLADLHVLSHQPRTLLCPAAMKQCYTSLNRSECSRKVHLVLVYGIDSRGDPKTAALRAGEDIAPRDILNIWDFTVCHNDLESYWHFVDEDWEVPHKEELSCPTGL